MQKRNLIQIRRMLSPLGPWLVSCGLCACATTFDGTVFRNGEVAFAVGRVPSEWRRIDVSDALIAFRDDRDGGTVAVNARCHQDGEDVPLEALTRHLFIYFTEREIESETRLALDGREALRTVATAKLDGVQKGFVVYVLKKDDCVYDFLYIGSPAKLGANQQVLDRFVSGFRTLPR